MLQEKESLEKEDFAWSTSARRIASILLVFYLIVVILGPLSNPVGSEALAKPLANFVAPIHQALFLGHGYRFFGPDPGPSHLLVYKVTRADGSVVKGQIPDRETHYPRLLYHRWFMLSETVFEEHQFTPDEAGFRDLQTELTGQIEQLRNAGHFEQVKQLERVRLSQEKLYHHARQRIDGLVEAISDYLLKEHGGKTIELFVQERSIPGPLDVSTGVELYDERYLSPLIPIGPGIEELPAGEPEAAGETP